jgi:hypothetical protein
MQSQNGLSRRVHRLEVLHGGVCMTCRLREGMAPDVRTRRIQELMAQYLGLSSAQIEAVIATLRGMTPGEIAAWVATRQDGFTEGNNASPAL